MAHAADRANVVVYWCEHNHLTHNPRGFPADGNLQLKDLFAMVRPKLEDPETHTCLFGYDEAGNYHDLNDSLDDTIRNWADRNFLFIFGPPGLTADDFDEEKVREELSQSMKANLTFRIYANTSFNAMTIGFNLTGIMLGDSYTTVCNRVIELLRRKNELRNVIPGDQPCLFLPGGMPWPEEDDVPYLREWHMLTKMKLKLYVVFAGLTPEMAHYLPEVYGIENPDVKMAMRTLSDDTNRKAHRAMALLMMYCRMGGIEAEKLLSVLAKVTGFAPLIVSLDKLIKGVNLRVFDLAIIVASLIPVFSGIVTDGKGSRICEHAIDLCGYLCGQFQEEVTPTLPLYEGRLDDSVDGQVHDFARAVLGPDENGTIDPRDNDFVLWNGDFGDVDTDLATVTRISLADLATAPKSDFSRVLENAVSTSRVYVPTFFRVSRGTCLYLSRASAESIFYFDPNCETMQELNVSKLSTGRFNEEDLARDVGDIGKELIEQDMILCMDCSASMRYRVDDTSPTKGISRRKIAEELMSNFLVNSDAFRVRQFVRIIYFSHECKFVDDLTKFSTPEQVVDALQRIKSGRQTRLYDALKLAADQLSNERNPRQRITVFSDGKDEGSVITIDELFESVTAANVVVDAICLTNGVGNENAFDYGLLSLVRATGGVFFIPDKSWDDARVVSEGIAFMQQEAFVNLVKRKTDQDDRKKSITELEHEAVMAATNPEHEWRKCHNLEAEELETIEKYGIRPRDFAKQLRENETTRRSMRIWTDAEEITRKCGDDMLVQFCRIDGNPSVFAKFYFKLSEGPYSNRWWCLVAKCSPLYPTEPPVFRFGPQIPFHPNVSLDGLVVCSSVTTEYSTGKSLLAQAQAVMGLLVKPEDVAPVNMMWKREDLRDAEIAKCVEGAMDEETFRDFCVAHRFDIK